MTTHDFDREQWVPQLCRALTNLAAVQSGYRHELDEHRQRRLATGSHMLWPVTRGNQGRCDSDRGDDCAHGLSPAVVPYWPGRASQSDSSTFGQALARR